MIAIFDFLLSNRIPISRYFTKYLRKPLYESHVCNRCFFKEMSFYGHELFRTVSDSCFRVTFISSSENHKRIIIFLLYLPFPLSFLYSFEQQLFLYFGKIARKKHVMGVYILLNRRSRKVRRFLRNFLEFPEQIINRTTMNDCL